MSCSDLNEFSDNKDNKTTEKSNEETTQENIVDDDNEMIDYCINQAFNHQQYQLFEIFASFMMHDGKNVSHHLTEIKDAISTQSRCILKLNNTIEKYLEQKMNQSVK